MGHSWERCSRLSFQNELGGLCWMGTSIRSTGLRQESGSRPVRENERDSFLDGENWTENPMFCSAWSIKGVDVYGGMPACSSR